MITRNTSDTLLLTLFLLLTKIYWKLQHERFIKYYMRLIIFFPIFKKLQ